MERLAGREGIRIRSRESGSRVGRGSVGGRRVLLALPQTYMNASGEAVLALCQSNGIGPSEICVVSDDIDLPLGTLRMRPRGSAGGQKGLEDIIRRLGSQQVPRLRIGIGPPREGWDVADFVLSRFEAEEVAVIDEVILTAADATETWVSLGMDACMNAFNGVRKGE